MKKYISLLFIAFTALMMSCFSGGTNVYTEPPPRTVPLDSVNSETTGPHLTQLPDSVEVKFTVTHDEPCPVYITIHRTVKDTLRVIVDSVYSPGEYSLWYDLKDYKGTRLPNALLFYMYSVCDSTYTYRLDLRRRKEY